MRRAARGVVTHRWGCPTGAQGPRPPGWRTAGLALLRRVVPAAGHGRLCWYLEVPHVTGRFLNWCPHRPDGQLLSGAGNDSRRSLGNG